MFSSVSNGIAWLSFTLLNIFISLAHAENNEFSEVMPVFNVQPQQCVTLRQGRDCFTTISIYWKQTSDQSLCLFQVNSKNIQNKKKLTCWSKKKSGQTKVEFESNNNLRYQLRTLNENRLLAESEIVVSWLHKSTTKRRRWRLF